MMFRPIWVALAMTLPFHCGTLAKAEPFDARKVFLPIVVEAVPAILESQDPRTGQFGHGSTFNVAQQNVMLILAAAWETQSEDNPYYKDPEVLDAILKGGDPLIAEQDASGRWPFRTIDGASQGEVYLPWTYSRWMRTFAIIKEAMPAERRTQWQAALTLGYAGIAAELKAGVIQNIPAHHAMGLAIAGRTFSRPDWSQQASKFLVQVAEAQHQDGFWSEHFGPVVNYNFVYVDALGTYYAISRDVRVLQALERASRFHAHFTYPDGSYVETIDERNPYDLNYFKMPNVGFTFSAEGRGFVRQQLKRKQEGAQPIDADLAASFVLYGDAGKAVPAAGDRERMQFVLGENDALIRREAPWFICLSAYHCPPVQSRWIQDRQNFVSIFHDRVGLILGGGNTKLQPLWSTFTVGDVALLRHLPGDSNPNFLPPEGLIHVPTEVTLFSDDHRLELIYGGEKALVDVDFQDASTIKLVYERNGKSGRPVAAHLPLLPRMEGRWRTASGREGAITSETVELKQGEAGEWFSHNGWRIQLPSNASIRWPALPHQPYSSTGEAGIGEGRIVVTLPFDSHQLRRQVTLVIEE